MKYKVGDKVRIVSENTGGHYISAIMRNHFGKIGTISELFNKSGTAYRIKEVPYFWFHTDLIAGLATNEKIVITHDGQTTTAKLYNGKKVIRSASAKCSPDDEFDFETGAKIAFDRLVGEKKEEKKEQFFNGRAVCIKKSVGYTEGEIYTFKDGKFLDDDGCPRPTGGKRVEERWLPFYRFIKINEEDNPCKSK